MMQQGGAARLWHISGEWQGQPEYAPWAAFLSCPDAPLTVDFFSRSGSPSFGHVKIRLAPGRLLPAALGWWPASSGGPSLDCMIA